MTDEGWVEAAMEDDSVAAEFLLHLKNGNRAPQNRDPPSLPLDWSIRQRRSKPILLPPKKSSAIRDSPTTPLSWSQATSHSSGAGAADNSDETSRPPLKSTDLPRSKVNGSTVATSSKRPRKKKSLAELREDEVLLLKERRLLKKELLALNISLEKQRTENESLKRMRLDLREQQEQNNRLATDALHNTIHHSSPSADVVWPTIPPSATVPLPNSCVEVQKKADDNFVLPDLNLPAGEDLVPEGLYVAR